MIPGLNLRPARADEAEMLSALALRSKGHWGYSVEFLEACRAELTYSAADIESEKSTFAVAEIDGTVVGFYALEKLSALEAELEALFVEPTRIGKGYGRALIEHAKDAALAMGVSLLVIQGDPHAERFYVASGAVRTGTRESASIAGRMLPSFVIFLARPPDHG